MYHSDVVAVGRFGFGPQEYHALNGRFGGARSSLYSLKCCSARPTIMTMCFLSALSVINSRVPRTVEVVNSISHSIRDTTARQIDTRAAAMAGKPSTTYNCAIATA